MSFESIVRARGEGVVHSYLNSKDPSNPHRSVKNLIEETTHEYGGRFLLELLQNAHDAHDADHGGGQVLMRFDRDEDEHGVLYVADRGRGFDHDSFDAICKLAQSSKTVGEGIGNKGVGFKSVLQICEWPEIYSCDPTDPERDGYSFRFATDAELRGMTPDEESFLRVRQDVSAYTVPVPVATLQQTVRELRRDGFRTVMRFPVRSEVAAAEVEKRFSELERASSPVMLFLRRMSALCLKRRGGKKPDSEVALSRGAQPLVVEGDKTITAEVVTVNERQRFLVVSRDVDPAELRAALRQSVDAELLNPKWLRWETPAHVAVAVSLDEPVENGRLYTYLPMGSESTAPLPGHVHAPFYTDFARRGLVRNHPLNAMLFDAVAVLALDVNSSLLHSSLVVPDADSPALAVDLVSWSGTDVDHLVRAAGLRPVLLPSTSGDTVALADAWLWPNRECEVLTPELADQALGMRTLYAGLDGDRLDRLRQTAAVMGESIDLTSKQLAEAVEAMARFVARQRMAVDRWDLLYDDIAVLFERAADALQLGGRRVLLAENWRLVACLEPPDPVRARIGGRPQVARRSDPTPFFPPVHHPVEGEQEIDPDVELTLPEGLSDRVVLLHPELVWHDEARRSTRARAFLSNNGLVSRFDARSLLDHVRRVLASTEDRDVHAGALRFLHDLQRGSGAKLDLRTAGVRLPTVSGAPSPATQVLFSSGWPGTNGKLLESVTAVDEETSGELSELAGRLLVTPSQLLRDNDDRQGWVEFLGKLGVLNELPVHRAQETRKPHGNELRPEHLALNGSLPSGVAAQWRTRLPRFTARFPGTPYTTRTPLTWLPGQDRVEHLPDTARVAYAKLVLLGLQGWQDDLFTMTWERDRPGDKDPRTISTPLGAFLSRVRWLVVHDPRTQSERFETLQRAWLFKESVPPRFAPVLRRDLRVLAETNRPVLNRLQRLGMPVWDAPVHAGRQLDHLASLLADGLVDANLLPSLRNTYRNTWNILFKQSKWTDVPQSLTRLIVATGDRLDALGVADFTEEEPVVVTEDGDDDFLRQVVADFEYPVLHLDRNADEVRTAFPGDIAARPDELLIRILLDGTEFTPTGDARLLVDVLPWLATVVTALLEHRTPPDQRPGESRLADIATVLAAVRVVIAEEVTVEMAGESRPAPARMRGVLPVPDAQHPTLVFTRAAQPFRITWELADAAAEPVLRLVNQTRATPLLRLAMARLRQPGVEPEDVLDFDLLADACEVEPANLAHTAHHLGSSPLDALERLLPVVHQLWGPEAAAELHTAMSASEGHPTELVAREMLREAAPVSAIDADLLFETSQRTSHLDELRKELSISLEGINDAVRTITPHEPLIDYSSQHAESFRLGVLRPDNRRQLVNRLRWALLPQHAAAQPIDNWLQLRDLTALSAPDAWRHVRDEITEAEILISAAEQLTSLIHTTLPTEGPEMILVEQAREVNRAFAEQMLQQAAPLVHAWLRKNGGTKPAVDLDSTSTLHAVNALSAAGALDFTVLDSDQLISWLRTVGVWPAGMPSSTDPAELDITDQDLSTEATEEEQQREKRHRERRILDVDGTPLDVQDGLEALRRTLTTSLENSPGFLTTPAKFTRLAPVTATGPRSASTQTGTRTSKQPSRTSPEQLNAVGFAGEWLAYQWLLNRFADRVTEQCWKSRNRAACFAGDPGDDSLGYDFSVPFSGGDRMFEVKATSRDGGEIQLGETEVRCAQENARNNRWRLLVITDALNRSRQIIQLPNPFSSSSRGLFSFVGHGVRLRYRQAT
ncbi:sacsin N-terminal ATP-binding-like domain-containing protein [Nocardia sp. NRRL S-836]|uniref:sacsin N-terminal ATP-binding-like domain-containing protein n=1 Tax=Nocardia sp. NRRL S-836 TaxID=1519492 RepID=UPI0006B06557|nr:DUF3883 domain-containing protein [Nocardia sp. NRRL S-836]KOV87558.1 hypothetical protein ADL03_06560 [Nocardia sp. NRRL S-836]